MSLKFFSIPARDPDTAERELNAFLASHRILSVERQLVACGHETYWAICVNFLDAKSSSDKKEFSKSKIDYKEILNTEQFSRFARLRDLRAKLAKEEAVPVYTIFTNEQLAALVTGNVTTIAEFAKVPGIGEARIAKYGAAFLKAFIESGDATSQPTV